MSTWVDGSTDLTVEATFGDAPDAVSPTWTDISAYVEAPMVIQRGQPAETVRIAPGTLTLRLNNRDRRFDPDYASGPYFGDLVPMVKIRVTATAGLTTVTLFTGFVLGWDQSYDVDRNNDIAQVVAVDASRLTANAQLAGSAFEALARSDGAMMMLPLQESSGGYADVIGGVAASGAWDLIPGEGVRPLGASATVLANTGEGDGFLRVPAAVSSAAPKSLEWWQHFPSRNITIAGAEVGYVHDADDYIDALWTANGIYVSYSNGADNKATFTEIVYTPPLRSRHFAITADASNVYLYVDGQLTATVAHTTTATSLSNFTAGAVIGATEDSGVSNMAVYSSTLSATDVSAHNDAGLHAYGHPTGERGGERIDRCLDEIGWPAGARSIDRGGTLQGPYLPAGQQFLDYARFVTDSEQGVLSVNVDGDVVFTGRQSLWQATSAATFSDDGAASNVVRYRRLVPAGNHVDAIANVATTSYSTIGGNTQRDATSRGAYGDARRFVDGPTIPTSRIAGELSKYVVREGKDPRTYIREIECWMLLDESGTLNEFDDLAGLDLGSLVTVKHTPRGIGSENTFTQLVSALRHEIGEDQWTVTISCSPSPTTAADAPYYTIGDATLGRVGAVYGNQVPF